MTLITEALMRELGVRGKKTTISLTTLSVDDEPTQCFAVPNLEVRGLNESELCPCLLFLAKSRCQCLSNRCHLSKTLNVGLICLTLLCHSSGQKLVFSSATMCQKLQSHGKL